MIFYDVQQNTEEWQAIRLGKFTASMFSDLFSDKSKVGYQRAIAKVVYERLTGESYGFYSNKRMEAGHDLELLAAEHYEMKTFETTLNGGFYEKNEWIGCSPDRRVGNNGGVEFKSRDPHIYFEYLKKGVLPSTNLWQVYGQLWITEWEWIDYMPYCHPKLKTLIIRVYPDASIFAQLEQKLNEAIEEAKKQIELAI